MKCVNSMKEMIRLMNWPLEVKQLSEFEILVYTGDDTDKLNINAIRLFITPIRYEFNSDLYDIYLSYSKINNAFKFTIERRK